MGSEIVGAAGEIGDYSLCWVDRGSARRDIKQLSSEAVQKEA